MERDMIANGGALPFVQVGVPAAKVVDRAFELELEIALLGACFNDPATLDAVAQIIEADDFREPINGRLFDVLLGRRIDGSKIDAALITDLVADLLLDAEGPEFVERYVDNIVRPRVKPKFPKMFAIKVRALAKASREARA